MQVGSLASATSTTVNNGGVLDVWMTGLAIGTNISGGSMTLISGGRATSTIVSDNGTMTVSLGTATSTTINSGTMTVFDGGVANSTIVNSSGSVIISGGSASTTAISGGTMTVDVQGVVDDTIVHSGGYLSVTDSGTVNGVVLSGGTFDSPVIGSPAIISGTVSGAGNITGPGDFTLADGNILLTSGGFATSGTLTIQKVLNPSQPAVSVSTFSAGCVDVTNLDVGTNTSGSLIQAGTALPEVSMTSGTSNGLLNASNDTVIFGGGAVTDTSIPGFMLDYLAPSATFSLTNSAKEISYSLAGNKQATQLTFGSIDWLDSGAFIDHSTQFSDVIFNGANVDTTNIHFKNVVSLQANKTMTLVSNFGTTVGDITGTKYTVGTTLQGNGKAQLVGNNLIYKVETDSADTSGGGGGSSGGGSSSGGTIDDKGSNNVVNITGGTLNDNIYGGFSTNGKTENNVVNLYGPADISGANLFGGNNGYKGNTLNVGDPVTKTPWTGGNQSVKNLANFEFIDFKVVPWSTERPALTITDGSLSDLSYTKVGAENVHFTNVDVLSRWDRMTLLNASAIKDESKRLVAANIIPGSNYTVGTTAKGTGTVSLDENGNVVYRVDTYADGKPIVTAQEQTHNTVMGMEAGLAVINSGNDFIEKAVDGLGDVRNTGKDGIAVFAAMGGGKDRYDTGSHINVNTWNGIVGVGKTNQLEDAKIQWGAFFEHGSGKFSLYNEDRAGDGSVSYTGGGLAAKWTNKQDVYAEMGMRYGRSHDSATGILHDVLGNSYGYNVHANYYGGYLGVGKVYRLGEDRSLDVYGKFFSNHRQGVSFDAGGRYDLDSLHSNILRVGAEYRAGMGKKGSWHAGLAYEHEFSGEATGRADGAAIRSASTRGGSVRANLGISMKPSENSPWTIDLGVTGHAGKRRGLSGGIFLSCKF